MIFSIKMERIIFQDKSYHFSEEMSWNQEFVSIECFVCFRVEPRLSGPRLSGLFDYPDFFSGPVFFMNINKL